MSRFDYTITHHTTPHHRITDCHDPITKWHPVASLTNQITYITILWLLNLNNMKYSRTLFKIQWSSTAVVQHKKWWVLVSSMTCSSNSQTIDHNPDAHSGTQSAHYHLTRSISCHLTWLLNTTPSHMISIKSSPPQVFSACHYSLLRLEMYIFSSLLLTSISNGFANPTVITAQDVQVVEKV